MKGDRKTPLPTWVKPQLAALVKKAPDGPDWLHEIKLDGYRMHARLDAGRVKILTRRGNNWTDKYPSIAKALTALPANTAYLDGELCGVLPDGRTAFNLMQNAMEHGDGSLIFFAFDLLHLDGESLMALPLGGPEETSRNPYWPILPLRCGITTIRSTTAPCSIPLTSCRDSSLLTHRCREMDSNFRYRGTKAVDFRSIPGMTGHRRALKQYHLMVEPFFFCASKPLHRAWLGHGLWLAAPRSGVFLGPSDESCANPTSSECGPAKLWSLFSVIRAFAFCALDLGVSQARLDIADDAQGDLVLDRKNIVERAIVALSPHMCTARRLDQLGGNAHPVSGFPQAAFEHISRAEYAKVELRARTHRTPYGIAAAGARDKFDHTEGDPL